MAACSLVAVRIRSPYSLTFLPLPTVQAWSFSEACSATWSAGGVFADMVEEFVAGTDPELAAAVSIILEKLCK